MSELLTPHFSRAEVACRCGCGLAPDARTLAALEALRVELGVPLRITSGARCATHNKRVGGAPASQHVSGRAVDVACTDGALRYRLLEAAPRHGFRGIGLARGFVHLDTRAGKPTTWFYSND